MYSLQPPRDYGFSILFMLQEKKANGLLHLKCCRVPPMGHLKRKQFKKEIKFAVFWRPSNKVSIYNTIIMHMKDTCMDIVWYSINFISVVV